MDQPKPSIDGLRIDRTAAPRHSAGRWPWLVVGLLLALGLLAAWWFLRTATVGVRTAVVRESTAAEGSRATVLNASGYVVARREATVSSKVTGKVVEVLIEEGMKVEAGQVLARLDASNLTASLRLAEAQLAAAQASLAETHVRWDAAEKDLGRVRSLREQGIAPQADLDHAEAEVRSYQARLQRQAADVVVAERDLAVWQQQMEDITIRAPFAGIATAKNAQPGEMISPVSAGGGFTRTGIGTIVDMASLEIEVDVNESYLNRVEAGQPVEAVLDAYPDWKIPCRVIAVIPTADRQKSTVKVRVGFAKLDPRLLPQMAVKVAFRGTGEAARTQRSLLVPKSAVRREDGREVAWVVRNGQLERRAITVGTATADDMAVLAGLEVGERVVVAGPEPLQAGTRVKEVKP